MRRNKRTLIAAIAVGALVLAGSAAFTDQLTTSDVGTNQNGNFAGYGTLNVTNGSLEDIHYVLDQTANPPTVTQVNLQMLGDTHLQSAYVGFNETYHLTHGSSYVSGTIECGSGSYDSGSGTTTYDCPLTGITGGEPTPDLIQDTDVALANT